MRSLGLLLLVACSGRSHEAGPTISPDRASLPATLDGAPAVRGRPLDAAALDALAAVTVAGHQVTVARRGDRDLAAIVVAPGGARVAITASACLACTPMALPAWEARRAELAALWGPAPDDTLTLSAPTVAATTVIAVDASRSLDGERRHTYQLHWNDGAAQLAAVCELEGCAAATATVFAAYLTALVQPPQRAQ